MSKLFGKITFWKLALMAILLAGAVAAAQRLIQGLGATTHLSDDFPWGMWIGFDVLVGVGLSAGGFAVAAAVHLFHMEKYESIARPAVLTALIGYMLVGVALMLDIGLPWRIWHPIIMWNPHSVMFEVAWCVMLYMTVLVLEFSPVVLERFGLHVPLRLMRSIYMPLVIAGVLLSMMHQSSLGSLFLIVPEKLHGLWYTPWLPVFFFISAIAAGLAMAMVESYLSHRAFGKRLEDHLLDGMARVIVVVLGVYGLWKLEDLAARGNLGLVFQLTPEAVLFWGEMGLGVLLPAALFASERVRRDQHLRFLAAVLTVIGFVVARMNVAITGMARSSGRAYFPSWQEIAVSLSFVALAFVAFALAVKYLDLFPKSEMQEARLPAQTPAFGIRGMPTANALSLAVLWALLGVGVVLFVVADGRTALAAPSAPPATENSATPLAVPLRVPEDYDFTAAAEGAGTVTFSHATHQDYTGGGCTGCHRDDFSIRQAGLALDGTLSMERMEQGELCGRCHDGTQAFGLQDNCEVCHQ